MVQDPEAENQDVTEETAVVTAKETAVEEQDKVFATPDPDSFDWENTGKNKDVYKPEIRAKLEEMYANTLQLVTEHDIVNGTVIGMTSKEVVINIGYKSDGMVAFSEFRHMPDIKVGDTVEVYIESQEDKNGQLILSHKKARALKSWERINNSLEKDEIIQGYVKCRTKGGLIVDVFGIEAFLPGSQIDVKPIRDYDIYVGKNMEFKVVKINNEFKNVVVSHKVLIEEELESQKMEIISKLEKGQVLEGTVKNITSYGVFMDLGGVDGLLHITDISWGRISHPEEVLELDQKINVVILDFDEDKKRIALGLKQLSPHPWDALEADLKIGDKVKGKVVVLADYGAFIEVQAGVEGLLHVSEMSWSQHLRSPQDFLKVGDEVETIVLSLDRDERKMSLGMKQLMPDPWQSIADKYVVGSKHTASVRNFTNFGVFVELEEGIDGLIHISDLSWSKKIKHPSEFTKVGEELEVVVLEVDAENRRLSLGHKQLEDNPWDVFETLFSEGSFHEGTVQKNVDKGALIQMPYGVEAFAPAKHLVKEDGTTARLDETLDFKVIEFSKENRKIVVSHSRIHEEKSDLSKAKEKADQKSESEQSGKTMKKMKDSLEKSTFGDLDVLSKLKTNLEQSESKAKKDKIKKDAETAVQKEEDENAAQKPKAKKATKKKKDSDSGDE
jgi:small subunit ribosomal protein S1